TRLKHVRQRARIILRLGLDLSEGDVAGGIDELAELSVRHRSAVDPEPIDPGAVDGRFLGVVLVGPHAEGPAGHPDHVSRRRRRPQSRRLDPALAHEAVTPSGKSAWRFTERL